MVSGFDGKPKGFCYAEFAEPNALRKALDMSGTQLAGRTVRISVAEPPKAGEQGRSGGDWTRKGPLEDLPGRSGSRPSDRGDRGSSTPVDSGRDWGDMRGSKFAPSVPVSPALGSARSTGGFGGGFDRDGPSSARAGGFRDRDFSPAGGPPPAEDRDWGAARGGRFAPTLTMERRPSNMRPEVPERKASESDSASTWRRAAPPSASATPLAGSPSSEDVPGTSTPPTPAAPFERKRLQLAPRSASSTSVTSEASPATPSSRANVFGAATPVDTAAREQALLDARIEKERAQAEERRAKAEADAQAKKDADEAAAAAAGPGEEKPESKSDKELNWRMRDAKIAEKKSANPGREWKRPAGPHAGLTDQQPTAPSSGIANAAEQREKAGSPTSSASSGTAPRQIAKNQGIRKEGFSYSNIAGKSQVPPTRPMTTGEIIPENTPVQAAAKEAETNGSQ